MRGIPKIFISYSHKDERWKDWLRRHLDIEVKQNRLEVWDDRLTKTGEEYRIEIDSAIKKSDIAILLISSHFLTSDFILNNEIPLILREKRERGLLIYPIIVSYCHWKKIDWLEPIQGAIKDNKPLEGRLDHEINEQFTKLVSQLNIPFYHDIIETISETPYQPKEKKQDKIFTIFEQDDIDQQSYRVSIYIQDEDEFNSEQIDFEFENIYNKEEQEEFISLLVDEFDSDVTIHFIIPPELFGVNFKQWRYRESELVKRYHILLHNKERFDSKLRKYRHLIRKWRDIYQKLRNKQITDALMCVESVERFDTRLDKIGVYFQNSVDRVQQIRDSIDMAKVGLWQYQDGEIEVYQNWIGYNTPLKSLESDSRKCDYMALLWDDMSLLKNLKELR